MILLVLAPSLVSSSHQSFDGQTSPTSSDAMTVQALKDIIATLSPAAITASGSSIMTIRLDASITPGTYTIEVQGRSGKLRNDAFISVTVVPEFSIGATLPSAVPADGTTTATS